MIKLGYQNISEKQVLRGDGRRGGSSKMIYLILDFPKSAFDVINVYVDSKMSCRQIIHMLLVIFFF